ncbi:MAG: ABATE domain-containing protein [Acidobacteriaceae bacterium]|nr:ABATE domain-containing protein [Acidobacteriaceae bacterium]
MGADKGVRNPDWKDGFLFIGNQLALDFLNTCPVQNGETVELLCDFGALLRWFQAADLLSSRQAASLRQQWGESARAHHVLEAMRELREKLRTEVLAIESGGIVRRAAVDELNDLLAKYPMLTRVQASSGTPAIELWFDSRRPEDLFAPVAHSAATLFAEVDRSRVRKCGQCVLHFYDTSKKGTRRWCSMQLCGNRFKVAAYAARRRTSVRN